MPSIAEEIAKASPEVLALLELVPAHQPPNGTKPNFANPPSRGDLQVQITSVVFGLMMVFFLNRAYVKLWLMRKVSWDDATLCLAVLGSIASYIACTYGVKKGGIGKHQWDISVAQFTKKELLISSWLIAGITPPTFLFLKTSFFILYLSLFAQLRWARVCSWIGLVVTVLAYTVQTILVFALSTPRKGEYWVTRIDHTLDLSVPQSIIGLIIDLYVLFIPVVGVCGLNLSYKRRIGVILIFLSGAMACVCSACSIYYRIILENAQDTLWDLVPVNISTLCEMFVGAICACMPSAAYAARQPDSMYRKCAHFISRLRTSWASSKNDYGAYPEPEVLETQPNPEVLRSTDKKYAKYFNLDELATTASTVNEKGPGHTNV